MATLPKLNKMEQLELLSKALIWWNNLEEHVRNTMSLKVRNNDPDIFNIKLTNTEIIELYRIKKHINDIHYATELAIDGFDDHIEAISNCNSYTMGLTSIEYNYETNIVNLHVRRPGLLIGRGGRNIDRLQDYLKQWYNIEAIKIIEVKKLYKNI